MTCTYCGVVLAKFADVRLVMVNRDKMPACRDIEACSGRKVEKERRLRNVGDPE
jgi:hypothetical protein